MKNYFQDPLADAPTEFSSLEEVERGIEFYRQMIADNPRNIDLLVLCSDYLNQLHEFKELFKAEK